MESFTLKRAFQGMLALAVCFSITSCGSHEAEQEGETVPIPALTPEEKAELDKFKEPELSASEVAQIMASYSHLDPNHEVPAQLLSKAVAYFDSNKARIRNQETITVVDFSPHSSNKRMFIINMTSGEVLKMYVAHGNGSDTNNDGIAASFGNVSGSNKSSLGFYYTAETYSGKHGYSLRLDGLSSTNSNVRARAIVVHSAAYVKDAAIKQGMSAGCLAVPDKFRTQVVDLLKNGSLIYAGLSG